MDSFPIYDAGNLRTSTTISGNSLSALSNPPLGKSLSGEVFLKVGSVFSGSSSLPYGADTVNVTNVAAGPSVIVYKLGSTTLKTHTISYENAGASASDRLTGIVVS